jgi:hypothetical protein
METLKEPPMWKFSNMTLLPQRSKLAFIVGCLSLAGISSNLAHANPTLPVNALIGVNKFDLLQQYLGTASGGNGSAAYQRVTQAMAKKAIADAHDIGVPFMRVAAAGFAPSAYGQPGQLDLWLRDPTAYWALYDQMMDDLHQSNMRAVLTLVWNGTQFPAITHEKVPDMLRNPNSKSYMLLSKYVTELVGRYRSHPALMLYELTNEMNLGADLDSVRRCRTSRSEPLCEPKGNFGTDDVVAFTGRLAELIRKIDTSHPISSGFSIPRTNAEGLRLSPEWLSGKQAKPDSLEQFQQNLKYVNQHVDVISVHLYANDVNQRFGSADQVDILVAAKRAADNIGKPLFVGEFGEPDAHAAKANSFSERLLKKIVELKVPYSAMWAWQFYQQKTYKTYDTEADSFNLEMGYTDRLLDHLSRANKDLGNPIPASQGSSGADTTPPRVVLTWPIDCAQLNSKQELYAVASDDRGRVNRVTFLMDGHSLGDVMSPPYKIETSNTALAEGQHEIIVKADDMAGNTSEWKTTVLTGRPGPYSLCASHAAGMVGGKIIHKKQLPQPRQPPLH